MKITINLNRLPMDVSSWNVGYSHLTLNELKSEGQSLAELLTNALIYTADGDGGTGITLGFDDLDTINQMIISGYVQEFYLNEVSDVG